MRDPEEVTVTLDVQSAKHVVMAEIKPECGFVWEAPSLLSGPIRKHACISVNHISTNVPDTTTPQIFHVCHCGQSVKMELPT